MRGFLPYKEIHSHLSFSGIPLFDFSPFEIQEDERTCRLVRIRKLLQFGVQIGKMGIPCLHYNEEKKLFGDRPNKRKTDGIKTKRTNSSIAAMDPNAAPINPYESDLSFDGLDGPYMGVPSQSPLHGHFLPYDDEEYSDEDDAYPNEFYYQNEDYSQTEKEICTNILDLIFKFFFCFERDFFFFLTFDSLSPATTSTSTTSTPTATPIHKSRSSSFQSPNLINGISHHSSSLRSPSMNATFSLADFSYPFAPPNTFESIDPKSKDPTPLSSPLPSEPSSLSEFSYPFAPPLISIDGRPIERLYSGSWTDNSPLETEVASAWNASIGKDSHSFKGDAFGASFFVTTPLSDPISSSLDVGRRESERYLTTLPSNIPAHRRGSMSHNLSNPQPQSSAPIQSSSLRSDRDQDGQFPPLPSFFLTSLAAPVKLEPLEKEDEEDVNFRTPFEDDSQSDALPVINTEPIEEDEEEEDEQQVGMSPLLYPLGAAPLSPWQKSPWKTPPLGSAGAPPGFGPSFYPKLSGSEGNVGRGVPMGPSMSVGNTYMRSPQVQIRWATKDVKVSEFVLRLWGGNVADNLFFSFF